MATITLYQFPGEGGLSLSPYCNKVHWALRLKGLLYRTEDVLVAKRVSETGRLPVLLYDNQKVHDSTEILRFLEARHPRPSLIPAERRQAAFAHVLEEWADEALNPIVQYLGWSNPEVAARFGATLLPTLPATLARLALEAPRKRILRRRRELARRGEGAVYALLEAHFDAIEALCEEREWLAGRDSHPSVADIAVAAQLFTLTLGLTPRALASLRERARTYAWLERFTMLAARTSNA